MKNFWWNPKTRHLYVSSYKIYGRQRNFVLNRHNTKKKHRITFESYQAAQALGWKKAIIKPL